MISTSILCRGILRKTTAKSFANQTFATTLLSSVGSVASGSNLDRRDDNYGCSSTISTPSSIIITTPRRTILSSSSFSSLPPEEEKEEKSRVDSLTPYQKEIELRKLDQQLSRLNTLRAINTGELYTFRGKFKMLSRDYGMGFLAWYWTCWFGTAGLSYLAIEFGGVDPIMVAHKIESFLGWEYDAIAGRVDPQIGMVGLVVAVNECLEPLRLPFVVLTTKPVVNFFTKKY